MHKSAMPQQSRALEETIETDMVRELVSPWQGALEELSPITRASYRRGTTNFLDWLAQHNLLMVNQNVVQAWVKGLSSMGYRPSSVNTWLVGLRPFFTWVHEQGYVPFNPTLGVRGIRRRGTNHAHRRDELTASEVLAVLGTCDKSNVGRRDYAMLSLMAYAALRQGEIYRADIEDLKTKDGRQVLWVQGKGSADKDDFVVLPPIAEGAIQDWLAIHPRGKGALFVSFANRNRGKRLSLRSIRQIVKERYMKAGVMEPTKTTHSLRHSAISAAIRNGASLTQVQAMARHANINTTMVYFHETGRTAEPAEDFITYK
jgi:integrase/recombinase XerD